MSKFFVAFALLTVVCTTALDARPDETALLALWEKQAKEPENHAVIVQDATVFEQSFAQSPLVTVARGLEAWHQLKSGNSDDARRLLGLLSTGGADPLAAAGREMAFRWLTRLDILAVKQGLLKVFADTIEYPDTLAPVGNLPASVRPPMADRWGSPWAYKPADFKLIKAGPKQNYVLQSTKLGDKSDLEKALAVRYGGAGLKIERVLSPAGGKAVLQFSGSGVSNGILSEGNTAGDISFPYFGERIVVLSNGDYWVVLPKP
ncbi:MAG: hypothetical protein WCH57_01095 [Verrucomicrobiota bacterium]